MYIFFIKNKKESCFELWLKIEIRMELYLRSKLMHASVTDGLGSMCIVISFQRPGSWRWQPVHPQASGRLISFQTPTQPAGGVSQPLKHLLDLDSANAHVTGEMMALQSFPSFWHERLGDNLKATK